MTEPAPTSSLANSDLVEDIFGLNLRGARTIKDMFLRPAVVFQAAQDPVWQGRYTPSIRLLFSLLALMALLQFLWAGNDGLIFQTVFESLQETGVFEDDTVNSLSEDIINTFIAIYPLAYIMAHASSALLVRIWGTGISAIMRLRFWFLAITPSTFISMCALFLILIDPIFEAWVLGVAMLCITMPLDALTFYRGLPYMETRARLWRSVLFALFAVISAILSSTIGFAISSAFHVQAAL